MKHIYLFCIFLFLSFTSFAQQFSYDNFWRKADSLVLEGLPKSALQVVNQISEQSRKDTLVEQQVKCVLYRMIFQSYMEEDAFAKVVNGLEKDLQESKFPVKPILHSLLAEVYWEFYRQNRWKIQSRAKLASSFKPDDIYTWDLSKIVQEIDKQYDASLKEVARLKAINVEIYTEILAKGDSAAHYLRPTLYDFLAHRALKFYTNGEARLTEPTYKFEVNQVQFFANANEFIRPFPAVQDSLSLTYRALCIFQDLIGFHHKRNDTNALADIDLHRIQFVYEQSNRKDKDTLYLEALREGEIRYQNIDIHTEYIYEQAAYYHQRGSQYEAKTQKYQWDLLKAYNIAEKAKKTFPNSLGAQNCQVLQNRILKQYLEIKTESVVPPDTPFMILATYANVATLRCKIIKIDEQDKTELFDSPDARNYLTFEEKKIKARAFFRQKKAIFESETQLPDSRDFQNHSTEIKLKALSLGKYAFLFEVVEDSSLLNYGSFDVSNLAYMHRGNNGAEEFFITDRTSGKPLPNVKVKIDFYDWKNSARVLTKTTYLETNAEGYFAVKSKSNEERDFRVTLSYQGSNLALEDHFNIYGRYKEETEKIEYETEIRTVFFIDRGIYRPGQKIFFKGLMLKVKIGDDGNETIKSSELMTNFETEVWLRNVNSKVIDTLKVKTNEFGTFSGAFTLPINTLTGTYALNERQSDEELGEEFRVEEYKRPTFEVDFLSVKEAFKLNDKVRITTFAKAFSGMNVTSADVKFTVIRKEYSSWSYWYYTSGREMEIEEGEGITNEKGEYVIEFQAIPDSSIAYQRNPIFTYSIEVEITDINGETRKSTKELQLAYDALLTSVRLPVIVDKSRLKNTFITVTNCDKQPQIAQGNIRISKFKAPNRIFRKQVWIRPDKPILSKEEFYQTFPYDSYGEEHLMASWEKETPILDYKFDTRKSKNLPLPTLKNWKDGEYIVEIVAYNAKGDSARSQQYIKVLSSQTPSIPERREDWIRMIRNDGVVGGKIKLRVGNGLPNTHILFEIAHREKLIKREWLQVNEIQKELEIPIKSSYEGGFYLFFSYVQFGRTYSEKIYIDVAKENLQMEWQTFRNKLHPGQKEKWKLKITNGKGKKEKSEMVATLYDASLDEFRKLNWDWTKPYDEDDYDYSYGSGNYYYGSLNTWRTSNETDSYDIVNNKYYSGHYDRFEYREYDELDWFGYNYFGSYNSGYSKLVEKIRRKAEYLQMQKSAKYIELNGEIIIKDSEVSGKVISNEDGGSLPGVNIIIKGTTTGTITDADGKFRISLTTTKAILVFSYVGFLTKEIEIDTKKSKEIVFEMTEDVKSLSEVVVTGYSSGIKKDITGSLSGRAVGVVITRQMGKGEIGDMQEEIVKDEELAKVKTRKNFTETAFFMPHLTTDRKGRVSMEFTIPESLTKWRLMGFAHTKNFKYGFFQDSLVTQKELMVVPNMPRFFREGDTLTLASKIANLSFQDLSGTVQLSLFDALTLESIDNLATNKTKNQNFLVKSGQNTVAKWQIIIPEGVQAITYRIVAKSSRDEWISFSDGEENTVPVLKNTLLVTESLPFQVRAGQTKSLSLEKLVNQSSSTLQNHQLTLEFTSNPAWYAVQALPYLMEFPHECAEQTFARLYANLLASHIVNSNPKIKTVFEAWRQNGDTTTSLASNLEKNETLKAILLEEMPWLRAAKNESERKKQVALLFDLERLSTETKKTWEKLEKMQSNSGGFPWFVGMPTERFISQHIITGFGHLKKLKVVSDMPALVSKAIDYLDEVAFNEYEEMQRRKLEKSVFYERDYIGMYHINCLYARSFFLDSKPLAEKYKPMISDFISWAKNAWIHQSEYSKALISLSLYRFGEKETPLKILKSLKETAQTSEDLGMYWKNAMRGYYWYEAPIETQALLIEAFSEITNDTTAVNEMKLWLLKQKQVQDWRTTKATTEACYALLLQGTDWLSTENNVRIRLGNEEVIPHLSPEVGTGYFNKSWQKNDIRAAMGQINIASQSKSVAYGALYWQYFEKIDKISYAQTGLKIEKQLFIVKNTGAGQEIVPISAQNQSKIGDLLKVRLILRTDRNMEYIHLKDMRSAGLEPVNVLSGYQWREGLYYYESIKDVANHYFFSSLPKGTHVFEYDLRVTHAGSFSNGIATIQCMYAPEFTSHSEGMRLNIGNE